MKYLKTPMMFVFVLLLLSFVSNVCESLDCAINNSDPHKVAYTITVDPNGRGNFTTVQGAIDSIPASNKNWIRILISRGTYEEKVDIPIEKPCVYLEGEAYPETIIQWASNNATDQSATFTSSPDNVVAKGIVFKNVYKISRRPQAPMKPALAARLYGDKYVFRNCSFIGIQDTLWDASKRHYFKGCNIEGAIDFIFGNGQSLYEECTLKTNVGIYDPGRPSGCITAQARHSSSDPDGFVFKRCSVTGKGKTLLGRAYGPYSRVVFYQSDLSDVVLPHGWEAWNYKGQEQNLMYAEEDCTGAGASKTPRLPWLKTLSDEQLQQFVNIQYIDSEGWLSKLPPALLV